MIYVTSPRLFRSLLCLKGGPPRKETDVSSLEGYQSHCTPLPELPNKFSRIQAVPEEGPSLFTPSDAHQGVFFLTHHFLLGGLLEFYSELPSESLSLSSRFIYPIICYLNVPLVIQI